MVGYVIEVLPLIRCLKEEFPLMQQPWYADDAGAGGYFAEISSFFEKLKEIGPIHGYFPEALKNILVIR
jgi:hypothetical protein